MIQSHIILATGWISFCVLHSVFASSQFKALVEKRWPGKYKFYRVYYTLLAFATFAVVLIYQFSMDSYQIFTPTRLSLILGIFITAVGLTIMAVCIAKYFMQLSGLKGLLQGTRSRLMISGIHQHVRHPLYAGTFIFIWGLLVVFPVYSLLLTDIIITAYTLIGLTFEEKKLEKEFGDMYSQYKRRVPMIIPRVGRLRSNWSNKSNTV